MPKQFGTTNIFSINLIKNITFDKKEIK